MDERQKREQEGSFEYLQMSRLRSSRHSSEGAVDFTRCHGVFTNMYL